MKPSFLAAWVRPTSRGVRLQLREERLLGLIAAVGAAVSEMAGPDAARDVVVRPAFALGKVYGARFAKDHEIRGASAIAAAAPTIVAAEIAEMAYAIQRSSNANAAVRVTGCPLLALAGGAGTATGRMMCDVCEALMSGLAAGTVPNAHFSMPERMGHGAKKCEMRFAVAGQGTATRDVNVPGEVKFMPSSERKALIGEMLSEMFRASALAAAERLDPAIVARAFSLACVPLGQRDGAAATRLFEIPGLDVEAAGILSNALPEIEGVSYDVVENTPDRYTWREGACLFVRPGENGESKALAKTVCEACRHYRRGVVQSMNPEFDLEVKKRLHAGDGHCEFTVARAPEKRLIRRVRRGWVDVGAQRVALLDAENGYYWLHQLMGETLEAVGRKAAAGFVQRSFRLKETRPDEAALKEAFDSFSETGFGAFRLQSFDMKGGSAEVVVDDAFEAWCITEKDGIGKAPVCHYVRGLVAGVVETITGLGGLAAEEICCRAKGDESCVFVVKRA